MEGWWVEEGWKGGGVEGGGEVGGAEGGVTWDETGRGAGWAYRTAPDPMTPR